MCISTVSLILVFINKRKKKKKKKKEEESGVIERHSSSLDGAKLGAGRRRWKLETIG